MGSWKQKMTVKIEKVNNGYILKYENPNYGLGTLGQGSSYSKVYLTKQEALEEAGKLL
jgi:hypothetical protein